MTLFRPYNPLECTVAPAVAYSFFRMSARVHSGAMSLRVASVLLSELVYGAAHVSECLGGVRS